MGSKDSKVIRIPMFSGLKDSIWPRDLRIPISQLSQDFVEECSVVSLLFPCRIFESGFLFALLRPSACWPSIRRPTSPSHTVVEPMALASVTAPGLHPPPRHNVPPLHHPWPPTLTSLHPRPSHVPPAALKSHFGSVISETAVSLFFRRSVLPALGSPVRPLLSHRSGCWADWAAAPTHQRAHPRTTWGPAQPAPAR